MLVRRLLFILLLLPLFSCGGGSSSPSAGDNNSSSSAQPRYLLGGGYPFPYNFSSFNASISAGMVAETANLAFIQLHWNETANPGGKSFIDALKDPVASARQKGLGVYIAMDPLNLDRTQLLLPNGLTGDFTSSEVQQAYLDTVTQAATTYQPDFFILMVEANLYSGNSASYQAFQQLYAKAYDAIKQASSKTHIAVSLVYLDVNNQSCFDSTDRAKLGNDLSGFPKQDVFAVSVYPLCYLDPKNIPDSFLSDLASLSNHPLFISETGWPSSKSGSNFNQAIQASYFTNLERATESARGSGNSVVAINYVSVIDASQQTCDLVFQSEPEFEWWCSLGIRNPDGSQKLSYAAMKSWKQSLYR